MRKARSAAVIPMGPHADRRLPAAALSDEGVRRARHGASLGQGDFLRSTAAGCSGFHAASWIPSGDLVGVAEPERGPGVLHPVVILM